MEKLIKIQSELKAPKNQFNKFGGYNYRSQEDILEALKPLLTKHECLLTVTDEMEAVEGRVYVKATATITDGEKGVQVTAYAREASTKKGMDEAQITGSASSYARKYALNGLFLIDDTKDADATNDHGKEKPTVSEKVTPPKRKPVLKESTEQFKKAIDYFAEDKDANWEVIEKHYTVSDDVKESINAAVKAKSK